MGRSDPCVKPEAGTRRVVVKRPLFLKGVGLACAGLLALLLVFFVALPGGKWRLGVLDMKVTGALPDIGWGELVWDLRPGSPVYLETLPKDRNPYIAVRNLYNSASDVRAGAEVFGSECASCHGKDGRGAVHGPDLTAHAVVVRSSDWSVYRAITRGVAGTAMQAHHLGSRRTWQLVAYVRSLGGQTGVAVRATGPAANVTAETLLHAGNDSAGWYTYSGDYRSRRFSLLRQITTANAGRLQLLWQYQLTTTETRVETTPLVVNGTMFLTEPPNNVLALDAASGALLWRHYFQLPDDIMVCCGLVNRGLAILDSLLYVGTLDAHLVALDPRTGETVWNVPVAKYRDGYAITGAPLAVKDMIVTGVAGGEYGIRGFVDAYDAKTGRRRWRFYTVPAPGERGSETWSGKSWRTGGAPTWLTGSYDPDLNLLYWGVGNPGPDYQGSEREGDNLFSNSMLALDAASGKLRWYFQSTPHDEHDWDAVQIPVLIDTVAGGTPRRLMAWANRNGFYYLLDRESGRFLLARPYVYQTWAERIDSTGRPIERPNSRPSRSGTLVYPSSGGGTNWWSPSFSPRTGLLYVPVLETGSIFFQQAAYYKRGAAFAGSATQDLRNQPCKTGVRALDPLSGVMRWEHLFPSRTTWCKGGGVLSTAGGVVFASDHDFFVALDAKTGQELLRFNTGGDISAAPVTYLLGGRQYVEIAAGRSIMVFGLAPALVRAGAR